MGLFRSSKDEVLELRLKALEEEDQAIRNHFESRFEVLQKQVQTLDKDVENIYSRLNESDTIINFMVFDFKWKMDFANAIAEHFNDEEINVLVMELNENPDLFPETGILNRAIAVVNYFDRRKRIRELLEVAMHYRPMAKFPYPR